MVVTQFPVARAFLRCAQDRLCPCPGVSAFSSLSAAAWPFPATGRHKAFIRVWLNPQRGDLSHPKPTAWVNVAPSIAKPCRYTSSAWVRDTWCRRRDGRTGGTKIATSELPYSAFAGLTQSERAGIAHSRRRNPSLDSLLSPPSPKGEGCSFILIVQLSNSAWAVHSLRRRAWASNSESR